MGVSVGGASGGVRSEMNIVPLIDVVLVLLIIFMVVIPVTQMGYEVNVPPKKQDDVQSIADPNQLIVRVDRDGKAFINQEAVTDDRLPIRLKEILTTRRQRIVFFAGDGEVPYDRAIAVLNLVRESGTENLGIVFEDLPVR